ncbi:substrate-binding periplasmic protein [Vibrio sp. SCSIO 43137]|uniref:substrate-binding periplasmic protein n=1 Tax=Vibrio sp. SCSIO 43137 TaxID=3021011 RepID=UPI002306E347|nr:ABC transporter substrate-binding protein [Vibrio sp. SCSIO 43137]WCE29350.1 ABC transporter substrate-binding protein [Vibrio sp. SCSIO 43137]
MAGIIFSLLQAFLNVFFRTENKVRLLSGFCLMLCLFFVSGGVSNKAYAQEQQLNQLNYYANIYPPYSFIENGEYKGVSIDLLLRAVALSGEKIAGENIHFQPWARALYTVENHNNSVLMTIARTAEREDRFQWVGPVVDTRFVLIAKKSSGIKLTNESDLKKYTIGAIINDISEKLLMEKGVTSDKIYHGNSGEALAKMLQFDRVQLWAFEEKVALWSMHKLAMHISDYEVVMELGSLAFYYAFNKNSDVESVQKLQSAIDQLKQKSDGETLSEFDKILLNYPHWKEKWQ